MTNRQISLHPHQAEPVRWLFNPSLNNQIRIAVVVASRGFGKSFLGASAAVLAANELEQLPPTVLNKNIGIICATHEQAADIYEPLLSHELGLSEITVMTKKPTLKWKFINGTQIRCISADAIDRMRGSGFYFIIGDELATWKVPGSQGGSSGTQNAWEEVIEPTVVTRWSPENAARVRAPSPGRALIISTVRGRDFLYDMSLRQERDDRWKTFVYDYTKSPYLSAAEIEKSRQNYDVIKFNREYLCDFSESGLQVFHSFNRSANVVPIPEINPEETVHVAIDFNIMLNATSFSAIRGEQVHVLGEHRGTANTEALCKHIRQTFPAHPIICYPDPSGNNKTTKAPVGQTDFTILREHGFEVRSKRKAPSVVDSAAAVNRHLCNANGETNLYIHPRCVEIIRSLERTVWNERLSESAVIDKSAGVEHFSDGLRYLIDYLFPLHGRPMIVESWSF